jgi:TonB-linked SusC/RagA family outer membrane protein
MKIFLAYFLLLTIGSVSYSQELKGKVVDDNGLPIPEVNVLIKGKNINSKTDFDGNFTIQAEPNDVLEFSMIGYDKLAQKATLNMVVVLKESNQLLQEVIVVGYGSKKAGSITGSVAQIKAQDVVKTPAQSAIQAIQGKAAGVNIVTNDEPGANPTITIRGLGTIIGGREPLYVIDGIETNGLNGLSPYEIETIDILKDASSLAIYGQKGANGVVVISTKKGKNGKLKINYNTYYGLKLIQKDVEMSDSYRYAYYNNSALGSSSYFNFDQPYNTNWLNEITDTGEVQSHYLSLTGGSENASFYFGVTNLKEKGILIGTQFERTNLNSRNDYTFFNKKLKINQSVNLSIVNNTPKPLGAFTTAYKQSPIVPVRFPNGRWGVPLRDPATGQVAIDGSDRFNNVGNPVSQLFYTNEKNKNLVLFGNIGAELQLLKDLKFNTNFGATFDWSKGYTFAPSREIWLSQNPTQEASDYPAAEPINTLEQRRGDSYKWNWDNYFTYNKIFGKHELNATVGMSRSTSGISENLSATRWNVPEQSNYWSLDLSSYNNPTTPGSIIHNKRETPRVLLAYFARVDYEYNEKYLLSASIRREGVSVFQPSKRWANFPGVSGGWVISKEDFLKDVKFLNYLKLRGGYGEVGNGNNFYALNIPVFFGNYNYTFGGPSNEVSNPGNVQTYEVDPNLTWETMSEVDFGIDFRILESKLSGSIDLYSRKSDDLLLPVDLPRVLSPERVTVNAGTVTNKGAELSLNWKQEINQNWKYSISGNISFNKNELTNADNAYFAQYIGGSINNGQWTKQVLVGQALGSFYVYQVTGIDGDGNFTYSDERVNAGSYLPTHTYGMNFSLNYKKFDFSVDAYGIGGNKIYNGKKAQRFGGENVEYDVLVDFWTPSNPDAANPRPFNEVPRSSTYYIEDGSYLRINNITLGYTFPKFFDQLDKVRLYATAVNPFVFTKYSGYSPELSGSGNGDPLGSAGIELDAYPTNRTFLFGLNVSF